MQTIYEASILLVDDNPDLLVLVGDSLRTAGYTCIRTAATCAETTGGNARHPGLYPGQRH